MLAVVYRTSPLLLIFLNGMLAAQQAPVYPVKTVQIFPNLGYGPDEWSLLRVSNPSRMAKSVRIDIYRGDGSPVQENHVVTVRSGESFEFRVAESATENVFCWARIEDVSKNKSGPPPEISARVERVKGNTLEDFPQYVFPAERRNQWVSPAAQISNKELFFLNVSNAATVLEICSVSIAATCAGDGTRPVRTAVKPRQAVVLRIGTLRRRALSIRSMPPVISIVGLLREETPMTREYSAESSITFNDAAEK